eukprot:jgi/Bigna1/80363/fgenesh1_pg.70_\
MALRRGGSDSASRCSNGLNSPSRLHRNLRRWLTTGIIKAKGSVEKDLSYNPKEMLALVFPPPEYVCPNTSTEISFYECNHGGFTEPKRTGTGKARSDVHRDGDWHHSVHIWLLDSKQGKVLVQRRSMNKVPEDGVLTHIVFDTNPGKLDVSAAGHIEVGDDSLDTGLKIATARTMSAVNIGLFFLETKSVFLFPTDLIFELKDKRKRRGRRKKNRLRPKSSPVLLNFTCLKLCVLTTSSALREIEEELGLHVLTKDLDLIFTAVSDAKGFTEKHGEFICRELQDVYVIDYAKLNSPEEQKIVVADGEVDEAMWIDIDQLKQDLESANEDYVFRERKKKGKQKPASARRTRSPPLLGLRETLSASPCTVSGGLQVAFHSGTMAPNMVHSGHLNALPRALGGTRCILWHLLISATLVVGVPHSQQSPSPSQPPAEGKNLYSLSSYLHLNLAKIISMTIRFDSVPVKDQNRCLRRIVQWTDAEFTQHASEDALESMWSTDYGVSEEEMLRILESTIDKMEELLLSSLEKRDGEDASENDPIIGAECEGVKKKDLLNAIERVAMALAKATMRGSSARFQAFQSATDQALQALFPEDLMGWGLCFLIVSSILGLSTCCCGMWDYCRFTRRYSRFRYTIDKGLLIRGRELGSGGFGSVYLCQLKGSKDPKVVKMIKVDMDDMSAVQEALEEAKKLISLRHRNIVQYIDIFLHRQSFGDVESDEFVCIVMEHCNGGCLRDLMDAEDFVDLTPFQVLDALHQVCLGLESTHRMNIVHTDIKLENIMVRILPDGRLLLKIGDFGLAVHMTSDGRSDSSSTTPGLLRVGSMIPGKTSRKIAQVSRKAKQVTEACGGTPAYIAPEVFECFDHFSEEPMNIDAYNSVVENRRHVVNFPVDVWALAFVLFELTGLDIEDEEPFPGQQALEKDTWQSCLDDYSKEFMQKLEENMSGYDIHNNKSATGKRVGGTDDDQDEKKKEEEEECENDDNEEEDDEDGEEGEDSSDGKKDREEKKQEDFQVVMKRKKESSTVGSGEWILIELVHIFRRMLERMPKNRPSVSEILKSPVFMLLPNYTPLRSPSSSSSSTKMPPPVAAVASTSKADVGLIDRDGKIPHELELRFSKSEGIVPDIFRNRGIGADSEIIGSNATKAPVSSLRLRRTNSSQEVPTKK